MTTCKKEWILLCCLVVVAACQREPMGEIDPEVREVNTQFVFNIATSAAQTKQASDAVQEGANPVFRGISDAKLMSYTLSEDGEILKQDAAPSKVYDLSQLVAAGSGPRRVLEMSLPIQTNTLLLYGRAPVRTDVTGGFSAKDYYGHLDAYTVSNEVGSGNFQLGKRLQNETGFYAMEKIIAGVLTVIMNTSMTEDTGKDDINTDGFTLRKSDYPNLWWSMYYKSDANTDTGKSPVETDKDRYPLEEKLGHLYKEMTTIQSSDSQDTELRAGSGTATLRIVKDLWSVINSVRCATPLSKAEAVAKVFAGRVNSQIDKYFIGNVPSNGGPVTDVNFRSVKEIGAKLLGLTYENTTYKKDIYWPQNTEVKSYMPKADELEGIQAMTLEEFPANFEMMRGAAYMAFDATHYFFYYPKYFNTSAIGGIPEGDVTNGFSAGSYYYPAELLYFGNSPLRTSDLEHKVNDYPETVADWNKDTKWATTTDGKDDWKGTYVSSTTHSVAMKYPIRYGVSMLETKVGYTDEVRPGTGVGGTGYLLDNNHAVQKRVVAAQGGTLGDDEEPDKQIAITNGSFKLVGVVVGGQPQNVGWDFLPRKAPGTEKIVTGFIYDKAVTNQAVPADGSPFTPNYTVVFDNYSESGYESRTEGNFGQEKVYVALEFQNCTGEDFYGNFNLIRNEGYFYLIGEVDPAKGGEVSWPTDGYVIPPYKYDNSGNYIGIPRVFIQDYKTSVTFKFGLNSLKYAYLTVPDLRASSLTMGLSVDIEWKQGLKYDEVVIGGN